MKLFLFQPKNKSSLKYVVLLVLEIGLLITWMQMLTIDELASAAFTVFFFFIVILFTVNNYYKSLLFGLFKKRLKKLDVNFSEGSCKIEIFQPSIKTTPLMKNDNVIVIKQPYKQSCNFIATNKFLILFFRLRCCFGIFQTEVSPIALKKNDIDENLQWFKKQRVFNMSEAYFENEDLVINVRGHINDIEKIKILGFEKIFI